jgi:hypothetical protein
MKKKFDVRDYNEQALSDLAQEMQLQTQEKLTAMAAAIDEKHTRARKVTVTELLSIKALVSYAAANTNMIESAVADRLCALCGAMEIEDIDADQYNTAIVFLVDFNGKVH